MYHRPFTRSKPVQTDTEGERAVLGWCYPQDCPCDMAVKIRWFYGQTAGGCTSVSCIGLIDVDIDRYRERQRKISK